MRVLGIKKARARSVARAKALEANVARAISETVDEVHKAGRENIDAMTTKRSGRLSKWYRKSIRSKGARGLVGYLTRKARGKEGAFYARFVHDGTLKTKARPFHDQAVSEVEGRHAGRMRAALARALSGTAAPSALGRTGGGLERNLE